MDVSPCEMGHDPYEHRCEDCGTCLGCNACESECDCQACIMEQETKQEEREYEDAQDGFLPAHAFPKEEVPK